MLSGGPLARTGVMAGMSGSPVMIDGKVIGAVAYSWGFSTEPIAGITPIEEMLAIGARDSASPIAWRAGSLDEASWARIDDATAVDTFLQGQWRRLFSAPGRNALPVATRGLDTAWLQQWSGSNSQWLPMQSGSSAASVPTIPGREPSPPLPITTRRGG